MYTYTSSLMNDPLSSSSCRYNVAGSDEHNTLRCVYVMYGGGRESCVYEHGRYSVRAGGECRRWKID